MKQDNDASMNRNNATLEENYPLLLIVGEDGYRKSISGRSPGITNGASTIISQWSSILGTCWMTSVFCILILFLTLVMILSSFTPSLYRIPYCIHPNSAKNGSEAIHLVHGPGKWTKEELSLLEGILDVYSGFKVHLTIIKDYNKIHRARHSYPRIKENGNKSQETDYNKKNLRSTEKPQETNNNNTLHLNVTLSEVIKKVKKKRHIRSLKNTFEEALIRHPDISWQELSYADYFVNTPLGLSWPVFNEEMKLFAVRVLELWQFGGVSFNLGFKPEDIHSRASKDVPAIITFGDKPIYEKPTTNKTDINNYKYNSSSTERNEIKKRAAETQTEENTLRNFIKSKRPLFDNLRPNTVIVDITGEHLATKTPCHVFFGEMLTFLKRATSDIYVDDIIRSTLHLMCKSRIVSRKVCDIIIP